MPVDMLPPEHSADLIDNANSLAAALTDRAIAEARKAANAPETHPDFDGVHCVECDTPIPEKRLAMQKVRCAFCQQLLEDSNTRRRKLYANPGA